MRDTKDFVNDFMKKYNSGQYPKIHQTNNGPDLTDAFVESQVTAFSTLLQTDIADDIMSGPESIVQGDLK